MGWHCTECVSCVKTSTALRDTCMEELPRRGQNQHRPGAGWRKALVRCGHAPGPAPLVPASVRLGYRRSSQTTSGVLNRFATA